MTEVNLGAEVIERVAPGDRLRLPRGLVAVCIPVFGAHERFAQCLRSVLQHTSTDVPIVVADDASPDPRTERLMMDLASAESLHHRLLYLRQLANVGFSRNVNTAFELLSDADVVVLNSDCIVGSDWLDRLRDAAYCDTTVATATALTNHGTILSVPERNTPRENLSRDADVEAVAWLVATRSGRLRPRIPTAIGHCMYIRRQALELVGMFDDAFSPGYGEEVDFSQRCVAHGLCHVAADDVFVYHRGAGSFGDAAAVQQEHEELIRTRHPLYHDAVRMSSERETGPLARAITTAATALRPMSLTVDARFLGATTTGTQVQALELIHALWRAQRADIRLLVPRKLGEWAREVLDGLAGLEFMTPEDALNTRMPATDVIHRPSQLFNWPELRLIPLLGRRYVVTHLDLIAYRNPTYHASFTDWREYQRLTRLSLSLADRVIFMSEHAQDDALTEELTDASRARVVHLGVDHYVPPRAEPRRPRALPEPAQETFLLCLGTNFRHKNRVFALRLLHALQERHGWDGWLILAGPHARHGTSAGDEAEFLMTHPRVNARVVDVHAVEEDEKAWLLRHAAGVVYPTTYEGFGLVPFEAAQSGTPTFFAWQTALRDVLPESAATLTPWAVEPSADQIASVLMNDDRRRELTAEIAAAGERLTWSRTAESIFRVYAEAVASPSRDIAALAGDGVPTTLARLTSIRNPEVLDVDSQLYRALYALTTNRATARPFTRSVKALYAAGYAVRHRSRPRPPTSDS